MSKFVGFKDAMIDKCIEIIGFIITLIVVAIGESIMIAIIAGVGWLASFTKTGKGIADFSHIRRTPELIGYTLDDYVVTGGVAIAVILVVGCMAIKIYRVNKNTKVCKKEIE